MNSLPPPGRRIYICGTSGSGKSTLAAALGEKLGLPHQEIDGLYHLPGWQPCPREEFIEKVDAIVSRDGWVLDGNYRAVKDRILEACDTLIWLDYPRSLVMRRIVRRTVGRLIRREVLWNGNRERFVTSFLKSDSVIWWAWTTHARRRKEADEIFARLEGSGKALLRFYHPDETAHWLKASILTRS